MPIKPIIDFCGESAPPSFTWRPICFGKESAMPSWTFSANGISPYPGQRRAVLFSVMIYRSCSSQHSSTQALSMASSTLILAISMQA